MDKVALLVNDSLGTKALSSILLSQNIKIDIIVVQKPPLKKPISFSNRINNLIKKKERGVIEFITSRRVISKVNTIEKKIKILGQTFLKQNSNTNINNWPLETPVFYTENINNEDTFKQLLNKDIELIVVWGTSILKPRLLSIPNIKIINAHTSILPSYKGTFSEFWQCFYQDFESAGITFHFVDKGVDTGDIIFQKRTKTYSEIDPFMLRALNTLSIIEYYPQVIISVLENNYNRVKQLATNRATLKYSDITLEKKMALYKRINLL